MIGVTIGTGSDDYRFYSKAAAQRMEKYTGLKVHILGDAELEKYGSHPIFNLSDKDYRRCFYLKFFLWDIFPEADKIVYFDCDYCALREWSPEEALADHAFCAVRDRCSLIHDCIPYPERTIYYFNAGFFLASRKAKPFFEECVAKAESTKRKWNDQCVWSKVATDGAVKVKYLPKLYNFLDYGPAILDSNPIAVHNAGNYDHYRAGTQMGISRKHEWDLEAMQAQSGLNMCDDGVDPYAVVLLPDGSDCNGNLWFISAGKHYRCDIRGAELEEVTYRNISDE